MVREYVQLAAVIVVALDSMFGGKDSILGLMIGPYSDVKGEMNPGTHL
jgi:hypothetical protein